MVLLTVLLHRMILKCLKILMRPQKQSWTRSLRLWMRLMATLILMIPHQRRAPRNPRKKLRFLTIQMMMTMIWMMQMTVQILQMILGLIQKRPARDLLSLECSLTR